MLFFLSDEKGEKESIFSDVYVAVLYRKLK